MKNIAKLLVLCTCFLLSGCTSHRHVEERIEVRVVEPTPVPTPWRETRQEYGYHDTIFRSTHGEETDGFRTQMSVIDKSGHAHPIKVDVPFATFATDQVHQRAEVFSDDDKLLVISLTDRLHMINNTCVIVVECKTGKVLSMFRTDVIPEDLMLYGDSLVIWQSTRAMVEVYSIKQPRKPKRLVQWTPNGDGPYCIVGMSCSESTVEISLQKAMTLDEALQSSAKGLGFSLRIPPH